MSKTVGGASGFFASGEGFHASGENAQTQLGKLRVSAPQAQ
ncbi:hypothetical protein A2U01_0115938, partial [Trifolium medium]|nr:hypothetical protein [Trifolium medium]